MACGFILTTPHSRLPLMLIQIKQIMVCLLATVLCTLSGELCCMHGFYVCIKMFLSGQKRWS